MSASARRRSTNISRARKISCWRRYDYNFRVQEMFRSLLLEFGGASAIGQLDALMDVVDRIVETDGFQGCIFVNAAMEFPLAHEPAHIAAARSKQAIEDIVYELAL